MQLECSFHINACVALVHLPVYALHMYTFKQTRAAYDAYSSLVDYSCTEKKDIYHSFSHDIFYQALPLLFLRPLVNIMHTEDRAWGRGYRTTLHIEYTYVQQRYIKARHGLSSQQNH